MREDTPAARLRYRFDNAMTRGVGAQIGLLAIATGVVIVLGTIVVALTRTQHAGVGFWAMMWTSLLHVVDNGNISNDSGSKFYIFVMLLVTIGGLTVLAALFGIITNAINARMEQLRRGRSVVLERDHTLILGWSPQIFQVLSELMVANVNQRRARIVVLSERDKPQMEEEIRARVRRLGRTRIVCRSGNPLDLTDLEIARPHTAKSIVILAPEADDPDTHVIKTLLAITHHPRRRPEPYHIVASIRDPRNLEVARMAGKGEAQLVLGRDLISRITVQTCRQSGLSVVYTELLDFDGDEIYFQEEPALVGTTFGDALMRYDSSALIGLERGTDVVVNPPMDTAIGPGDRVIAVSEDDDTIRISAAGDCQIDESAIRIVPSRPPESEKTIIFNWNSRARGILAELDSYVAAGSVVTVVTRDGTPPELKNGPGAGLQRLRVDVVSGDPTDRDTLDRLQIYRYDHVIVLGESDSLPVQEADARTLTTLLHLRSIGDGNGHHISVVSEMADLRNRELAAATRADDFIVSDQLVSLMLSQLSENSHLQAVFDDLFDPEGSEIYLKPMEEYVTLGREVNFYTVVESARRRGQIAIGYRRSAQAENADDQYGVRVNPRKSEIMSFESGDKIIVVAED